MQVHLGTLSEDFYTRMQNAVWQGLVNFRKHVTRNQVSDVFCILLHGIPAIVSFRFLGEKERTCLDMPKPGRGKLMNLFHPCLRHLASTESQLFLPRPHILRSNKKGMVLH